MISRLFLLLLYFEQENNAILKSIAIKTITKQCKSKKHCHQNNNETMQIKKHCRQNNKQQ